jgi:hypothetical protein
LAEPASGPSKKVDLFKPAKAEKDTPSYQLDPEKDGLVYRGPQFTAHIARDGVVNFTDKVPAKKLLPMPVPLPPGTPTLVSTIRDHLAHRPQKSPAPDYLPPAQVFNLTPSIWPSASQLAQEDCESPSNANPFNTRCRFPKNPKIVTGGAFVDWDRFLLGLPKNEMAREEKARFLATTEPLRTRMATEARAEDLQTALWDLPGLLDRIWSKTEYPPAERRRLIYELWLEYSGTSGNESACATIMAFIRRRLPVGSPDAYTADELHRLRPDAGPRFAPYAP